MNFEQLEIITTLSEEKSFSKTANKLHLTTSAISQAVSSLENELKIKIFERSKQGSFPTIQGQYIIRNAYMILERKKDIYAYCDKKFQSPKVKLRIGCIPGINSPLIKSLQKLKNEYPFIESTIIEQNTEELLILLQQEKLDFVLIAFSDNIKNHNLNYEITKIIDGEFYFLVNQNSPIASFDILDYENIINQPLAIYNDKFLLNYLSHIENETQKSANVLFQTNNFSSIINSVEQNMAISFGPSYAIMNDSYDKRNNIKTMKVVNDNNTLSPALWFLKIKNKSLNEIGEELFKNFNEEIKQ
ncbi:LysR family transcriptional regulator [Clostridium ihumii]|uniref:LysR family transcriptional regulator n=1 Tax=Clostridium ihumii TaxID=1470356 RepID=UPI00055444C1|nr:LysR family transcriptional regulator [Clostridium ihumii]